MDSLEPAPPVAQIIAPFHPKAVIANADFFVVGCGVVACELFCINQLVERELFHFVGLEVVNSDVNHFFSFPVFRTVLVLVETILPHNRFVVKHFFQFFNFFFESCGWRFARAVKPTKPIGIVGIDAAFQD